MSQTQVAAAVPGSSTCLWAGWKPIAIVFICMFAVCFALNAVLLGCYCWGRSMERRDARLRGFAMVLENGNGNGGSSSHRGRGELCAETLAAENRLLRKQLREVRRQHGGVENELAAFRAREAGVSCHDQFQAAGPGGDVADGNGRGSIMDVRHGEIREPTRAVLA